MDLRPKVHSENSEMILSFSLSKIVFTPDPCGGHYLHEFLSLKQDHEPLMIRLKTYLLIRFIFNSAHSIFASTLRVGCSVIRFRKVQSDLIRWNIVGNRFHYMLFGIIFGLFLPLLAAGMEMTWGQDASFFEILIGGIPTFLWLTQGALLEPA